MLPGTQALSQTAEDSQERFVSRRLLPGMAKRLRQVGVAAPVVAALITGDKEGSLSEMYGGTGTQQSPAVAVYEAIGTVRDAVLLSCPALGSHDNSLNILKVGSAV